MRVAITGGFGFLGWHTACQLRALHGVDPVRLGREDFVDSEGLASKLDQVDAVIHIAGVNRADCDRAIEEGNVSIAQRLASALDVVGRPIDLVYANSVQARMDNPYGRGKARAAEVLGSAVHRGGGNFADLLLPNLFGEHGRPGYNSFVATFAHEIAGGRRPTLTNDREIRLLHAQDAANELIVAVGREEHRIVQGEPLAISRVLELFEEYDRSYRRTGEIPDLTKPMNRDLFNTYRSAAFPDMWPIFPQLHDDSRGRLFETTRVRGGTGMSFTSTTKPGHVRGDHYHLRKVERFCVVQGEAEIRLRRLLHGEVTTFRVSGDRPCFVDMPTLWVHNVRNVGSDELIMTFWSDQILNSENPDQFPEAVAQEENA